VAVLHLASKISGATIVAGDEDVGTLEDFYFQEASWTVRYLLVDTGSWLSGRKVLIAPESVEQGWRWGKIRVNLTREQVTNAPSFDPTQPVMPHNDSPQGLRSTQKTIGYHLRATDGDIGHVDDFLISAESWKVRYVLVDTSNWLGGRSVIVSTDTVEAIDRAGATFSVNATRDTIKNSPSLESIESALDSLELGPPFTMI
jgi:uncharacterized protein YrrD